LAEKELVQHVNRKTGVGMDAEVFAFGFARHATTYKRGDSLKERHNGDTIFASSNLLHIGPLRRRFAPRAFHRTGRNCFTSPFSSSAHEIP
jgi:hypothetical protein